MGSFWVYILRCADGAYYIGHTNDLAARLWQHDTGALPCWTKKRRPLELLWMTEFSTRSEALERELQLKRWCRAKKEALIREDWNRLQALSKSLGLKPALRALLTAAPAENRDGPSTRDSAARSGCG